MAHLVQVQNKWVNLDHVMWIEDTTTTPGMNDIKVFFEKSTILVVPKKEAQGLLDALSPLPLKSKK